MTSWHEGGAGDARVVTVHVPLGLGAYEAKVSDLLRRPTCPAPSSVEEDEGRARVLHWLTAWLHALGGGEAGDNASEEEMTLLGEAHGLVQQERYRTAATATTAHHRSHHPTCPTHQMPAHDPSVKHGVRGNCIIATPPEAGQAPIQGAARPMLVLCGDWARTFGLSPPLKLATQHTQSPQAAHGGSFSSARDRR